MKPYLTCLAVLVALGLATRVEAGPTVTLDISYSGPNLGVSGTGVLQAISAGNGEYDAVSGYIDAVLPGIGTVHETLVANPNAPNFAATAVFSNANGDNFVYDDRIFIPYNSPASTDGAAHVCRRARIPDRDPEQRGCLPVGQRSGLVRRLLLLRRL